MKCKELKENSEFYLYGKRQIVHSIDPPFVSYRGLEGTGKVFTVRFVDLLNDPHFSTDQIIEREIKQQQKSEQFVLDMLSEDKRKRVLERKKLIEPIILLEKAKAHHLPSLVEFLSKYKNYLPQGKEDEKAVYRLTKEKLMSMICQEHGKSIRTLKRWIDSYKKEERESGLGISGLMSSKDKGFIRQDNKTIEISHPKHPNLLLCNIQIRLPDEYLTIIKESIEKDYLNALKISKSELYKRIEARCTNAGIVPPPYITVSKIVDRLDHQIVARLREGKNAVQELNLVQRGFSNNEALYPLHMVQIDHTPLDIDVLDDSRVYVIGKPWLTLGVDVYSRMIWCVYISFEDPSGNVIRKALINGIFLKKSKERFGTDNEWDIHGVPRIIFVDNGSDFRSGYAKRMIEEVLGCELRHRPVRTPRFGGVIERHCGTLLESLIHQIHGTRKSNPTKLGDYDPEEEACLTLSELTEIVVAYITDDYHHRPHKGLPLETPTPTTRYYEGLKVAAFLPDYFSPEQEEVIKMQLLPIDEKRVTRDGIRFGNVIYSSPNLAPFVGRSDKHNVKYDDDDISKLLFQVPTGEYITIPAVLPSASELSGMNRFTYNAIRNILREEGKLKAKQIPGTENVARAKHKLMEKIEKKYKKSRRTRRMAAKANVNVTPNFVATNTEVKPTSKPGVAELFKQVTSIKGTAK